MTRTRHRPASRRPGPAALGLSVLAHLGVAVLVAAAVPSLKSETGGAGPGLGNAQGAAVEVMLVADPGGDDLDGHRAAATARSAADPPVPNAAPARAADPTPAPIASAAVIADTTAPVRPRAKPEPPRRTAPSARRTAPRARSAGAVASRPAPPASGRVAGGSTGDIGDTDGRDGRGAADNRLTDYLARVQAQLARHRRYPPAARRVGRSGTAKVRFTIEPAGTISGARLVAGSGFADLDAAALATPARAAPFPAIPSELGRARITVTVPVAFRLWSR